MAPAILLDPDIVQRSAVVIWVGDIRHDVDWSYDQPEFNLRNDVHAANVVFGSGIALWHSRERLQHGVPRAGTSSAAPDLSASGNSVAFTIPDDAMAGKDLHVICTVRDSGTPQLTRHQRVVVSTL